MNAKEIIAKVQVDPHEDDERLVAAILDEIERRADVDANYRKAISEIREELGGETT